MRAAPALLALTLAACGTFPELDARLDDADRTAPWPDLVPVAPLLAEAGAPGEAAPDDLAARLAALQARADALRAR